MADDLKLIQAGAEAYGTEPSALRLSAAGVEVSQVEPSALRVTAVAAEGTSPEYSRLRATQIGVEAYERERASFRLSQIGVEVWTQTIIPVHTIVADTRFAGGHYPIGFEVGQRMESSGANWPDPNVAAILPLDVVRFTQIRQRTLAARHAYGFPSIPIWMSGSSRAVPYDPNATYAFPDHSILRTLRDLMYSLPLAAMLVAARFSTDASFSLGTGAGIPNPRVVYQLSSLPSEDLYLGNGVGAKRIRPAASVWDFMTAFDPIWMSTEDDSVVLRNLETPLLAPATIQRGITGPQRLPQIVLDASDALLSDAPAAAVWDDARSLRDDIYTPPLVTVSPTVGSIDLAGDLFPEVTSTLADFWSDGTALPGYPTPMAPTLNLANSETWTDLNYPAGIAGVPDSGTSYLLLPRVPQAKGVPIYAHVGDTVVTLVATPTELQNAWDTAGALIRTPRRTGETDFRYAGRQQRLWTAAQICARDGIASGSTGALNRNLSAQMGRTIFVPQWNGLDTSELPANTTQIDLGDDPTFLDHAVLRLQTGDLKSLQDPALSYLTGTAISQAVAYTPPTGTATAFKCAVALEEYKTIHILLGDTTLQMGKDWLLSTEDATVIFFAAPIALDADLTIVLAGRDRLRVGLVSDPTGLTTTRRGRGIGNTESIAADNRRYAERVGPQRSATFWHNDATTSPAALSALSPEPHRAAGNFQALAAPLIVSRGPRVQHGPEAERRIFTEPGGVLRTPFGQSVLQHAPRTSWNTPSQDGASNVGVPYDMDLFGTPSSRSDGCASPAVTYLL